MSTINPSVNYYQLSGSNNGSTNQTSGAPSLAELLQSASQNSSQTSSTSSAGAAYLLDLSPESQQFLNSGASSASSNTSSSSSQSSNANFTLTSQQQDTINSILAKYKDAPFIQATFDSIQNDLKAAGLSPDLLSEKDKINSFNPTLVFLDAISGDTNGISQLNASTSASAEQTKSSNYMQQIISDWKSISTTASSTSSSPVSTVS